MGYAAPKDRPFLHTFQSGTHTCPGKPLSLLKGRVFLLLAAMQFKFDFPGGISKVVSAERWYALNYKANVKTANEYLHL